MFFEDFTEDKSQTQILQTKSPTVTRLPGFSSSHLPVEGIPPLGGGQGTRTLNRQAGA